MNDALKTDLESLVEDFKFRLYSINIADFNSTQKFVDKCQDLLNTYLGKMTISVHTFSTKETFREDYIPSFEYRRKCQSLFETYLEQCL